MIIPARENLISFIIPTISLKRVKSIRHILQKSWGLQETVRNISDIVTMPFEIVVVCNSLDDDLINYIEKESRIKKYCINNLNVGVSRSWNIGAMLVEGNCLCFINDDVELGEGSVEELMKVLQFDNSIGEVGPAGGKFISHLGEPGHRVGTERIEEADEISGFMFIIKRHVFDLSGGFDIAFTPASYEEVDMSYKIRSLGFKCVVVPNLRVTHHNYDGISTKKNAAIRYFDKSITTEELNMRNKRLFIEKWRGKL